MSTCQGAPAPHEDCPHGARCDWTPPGDLRAAAGIVYDALLGRPATNRRERRAAARNARKLSVRMARAGLGVESLPVAPPVSVDVVDPNALPADFDG